MFGEENRARGGTVHEVAETSKRMTNLKPMKSRNWMKSRRLKKNFKPITSLEWTEKHRPMQKLMWRELSHTKNSKSIKQRNLLNSGSDEGVQVDEEAHADEQAELNKESQAVKAAQAAEESRADGTQVDGVSQRVQGSNSTKVRSSADLALRVVDG